MTVKKLIAYGLCLAVAGGIALQLVPYGRNQVNPPVVKEPSWDTPATRALVKRACFNCHSHETVWPWYAKIAPASWLVYHDVVEARAELNFSNWQDGMIPGESPGLIQMKVLADKMPPIQYRLAHPEARLTAAEKQQLIKGLTITINK
jgi:Haem-binding domain